MNPEREETIRGWFRKAEEDLEYARLGINASGSTSYLSGAVYHCQQAAEKALKALHCLFGLLPPKTHDLVRLGELLGQEINLEDWEGFNLAEAAAFLTPMATEYRYPPDGADFSFSAFPLFRFPPPHALTQTRKVIAAELGPNP